MRPNLPLAAALLAAVAAAAGCAASSPKTDSVFGDSARQLRAQQIIDADAPRRNGSKSPPTDGDAVLRSIDRYRSGPARGGPAPAQ